MAAPLVGMLVDSMVDPKEVSRAVLSVGRWDWSVLMKAVSTVALLGSYLAAQLECKRVHWKVDELD